MGSNPTFNKLIFPLLFHFLNSNKKRAIWRFFSKLIIFYARFSLSVEQNKFSRETRSIERKWLKRRGSTSECRRSSSFSSLIHLPARPSHAFPLTPTSPPLCHSSMPVSILVWFPRKIFTIHSLNFTFLFLGLIFLDMVFNPLFCFRD